MRFAKGLFWMVCVGVLGGCGGVVVDGESEGESKTIPESTSRWSFELPGDGTLNDNGYVGPFCCTGETVVVRSEEGVEVGYAYFFAWTGQAYNVGDYAVAPDVRFLLAGRADLEAPAGLIEKGEIGFTAQELVVGASRSAQVGALVFTVTVRDVEVEMWKTGAMFDMGSLAIRVDVDPAEVE